MKDQGFHRMNSQSLSALIAFSAAQSYSVGSSNPLDVVVPLFQPIATARHGRVFDPNELARDIYERYDLLVSEETCRYWGHQLIKKGVIVPADTEALSGALIWQQSNSINAPEGDFSADLERIATAFRSFLKLNGDLFSASYTDEKLFDILQKGAIGSLFPRLYETTGGFRSDEQYVFSRFVESLSQAVGGDPVVLDAVVKLRRAAIFCDLILHMQEPKAPPKNPQPISVYIDSPLVMDIIGLSGTIRKQYSQRLMEGFARLGFSPMINPDMIFEVRNNIKALLKNEPAKRFGPTADAIRNRTLTLSFVEAALERVEPMVQDAGIVIDRNFPSHANRSVVSDELEQALFAKLQSHYNSLDAASRDAKTVRGVLGRRGATRPLDMYSSRAFFLTGNEMVATISNRFFRENIGYTDKNFPIVISRSTAAALTDAIVGVERGGSLSLQDLLVSAADVTQYDPVVIAKIEEKLRDIKPEEADDLVTLLSSVDYSQLAMDMMRGNTENVTGQSVSRLVENVKVKLEEKAEKRVAARRTRERALANAVAGSLSREVEDNKSALSAALAAMEQQHKLVRGLAEGWIKEARSRVKFYQRVVAGIAAVVGLLVGCLAYVAVDRTDWLEANPSLKIVVAVVIGIATSVPLVGVPPLRNAVTSFLSRREWSSLRKRILALGYELSASGNVENDGIVADIDGQFSDKVTAISASVQKTATLKEGAAILDLLPPVRDPEANG